MNISELPRKTLGFFPTPLHKLENLTKFFSGPNIYIKRDDMTGLAFGGNKTRKLEFLIGEALKQNCDCVITGGAAQSNHCRQTAAATAMSGLECHLALGGKEPQSYSGNLLLDKLFNAKIHWTGELRKGEKIPEIADELRKVDKNPYIIPYGGSNIIGALGFVEAANELKKQIDILKINIDQIIFSSSSGGTHSGLIVGNFLYKLNSKIVGVQIDKAELGEHSYREQLIQLSNEISNFLGLHKSFTQDDLILRTDFMENEYGVVGDLERKTINLLANKEGILLDPVYTGRAFGGLIKMIEGKEISPKENILFWHTGGTTTLFSYADKLI